MSDLNEIKRKYKSLAEYIEEVDEDGKIIFLDNDTFCNRLNELTPTKRYVNVIIWLRFLLERKLITPEQISTIKKLIKRESLARHKEIQDYIQDIDEQGKIVLLPKKEMWEKIYSLGNSYVLIHYSFEDLLTNNLLSQEYLSKVWNGEQGFLQFIEKRYNDILKQEELEWQIIIKNYIRSDKPISEKVKYLTELIADIKDVQLDMDDLNALKSQKKFLKILLKELKDKQKFEMTYESELIADSNRNFETKNNTDDENYRKFWEPLLSKNPKTGKPLMTEEDFNTFLNNIINSNNIIKPLIPPDIKKAEFQHGIALFLNKFGINKWKMVRILIETFPAMFKKSKETEYTNIRLKHKYKSSDGRLFK